ncbi:MAG: ImmA/IrrE family metallo-endopeptidase [Anaerolineae bacterium]|nr:ImmA/IrrE family metallo-endopeptidase [Anaerolineae bacterium]
MPIHLGVTPLSHREIRQRAQEFLREHSARAGVPVQIEELVDLDLRIHVYPVPNLRMLCTTDAFISSDFTRIVVDDLVYSRYENRLRFSLAHEVAHLVLHRPFFARVMISSIEEYLRFQNDVDAAEYDLLERQADEFAGLVLVPPGELAQRFAEAKRKAERRGVSLERDWETAIRYVANSLSKEFKVSAQAVEIRLRHGRLVPYQP